MILGIKSADLPEETWINFASWLGWQKQVMTTTESPNYLVDNPETYIDYLERRYMQPIRDDVKAYNIHLGEEAIKEQAKDALALLDKARADAKAYAEAKAIELIQRNVEPTP